MHFGLNFHHVDKNPNENLKFQLGAISVCQTYYLSIYTMQESLLIVKFPYKTWQKLYNANA